jgi:NADH-quinone oxidoreductase subunit E
VLKAKIGEANDVSADGKFSWEEVECLGACCNAPMAAINDYYYEDLTPESLAQILDDFAAGKSPQPGSYDGRKASEPKGAIHTLTDPKLYDGSLAKKIKIPNLPEKPKKAPKTEPAA